ncbi:MAG: UDP-N-acetylmuramoyl-tripeptide--D-alanyl-D-alanine ligase [Clostridiales bacterium]|nr:UDP-N-acetylmuramoyl-tripeptide--D-alanyl-D-alanine ligase [Clostridiales bacterium]
MEPISVQEILTATNGTLISGRPDEIIYGVSTDSRKIKPGELFIALIGERFDGHDFILQAVENGAKAVLTQKMMLKLPDDIQVIQVDNTLMALQDLAACYRIKYHIPVIGVTGSTGKTTTKDMIHHVLMARLNALKTEGNLNNEIGLPLTLLGIERQHEIAVVEMGMSGLGEIRRLAEISRPNVAVITNIGVSHIEKLGSRENILKAKMEIFYNFPQDGAAVVNGDDNMLWGAKELLPNNTYFFGTREGLDFQAADIETTADGTIRYRLISRDGEYPIELPVMGKHNVYNSLAAVAVGRLYGMDYQEIREALHSFKTGSMRLNILTTADGVTIIDDVYNASPDSMKAALAVLKDIHANRRIAVLGDMLELGEYSEEGHREVGRAVADNRIDLLITKGGDSSWIGQEAKAMGMEPSRIFHRACNKDVINLLGTIVQSGDTILVKGSRGMRMEEIVSFLLKGGHESWKH